MRYLPLLLFICLLGQVRSLHLSDILLPNDDLVEENDDDDQTSAESMSPLYVRLGNSRQPRSFHVHSTVRWKGKDSAHGRGVQVRERQSDQQHKRNRKRNLFLLPAARDVPEENGDWQFNFSPISAWRTAV